MNESDYSCCSIEGEEACLESDAEASSSGDSNEELNRKLIHHPDHNDFTQQY